MAEDSLEQKAPRGSNPVVDCRQFFHVGAQAVHARIDLEMDRELYIRIGCRFLQQIKLASVPDCGRKPMTHDFVFFALPETAQYQNALGD